MIRKCIVHDFIHAGVPEDVECNQALEFQVEKKGYANLNQQFSFVGGPIVFKQADIHWAAHPFQTNPEFIDYSLIRCQFSG